MKSYSKHNNTPKSSGGDAKAGGTNHGATGGLHKASSSDIGTMKKPDTKNLYPNGLS